MGLISRVSSRTYRGAMSKSELAAKHIKKAEEALKTGLLKWNPDFDSAAFEKKAAEALRTSRQFEQAISLFEKSADNQLQASQTYRVYLKQWSDSDYLILSNIRE